MKDIAIVYSSKCGHTKQYADWLKEEIDADVINITSFAVNRMASYRLIIFACGVYGDKLSIMDFVKKNITNVPIPKVMVMAVSWYTNDSEEAKQKLIADNYPDQFKHNNVPIFIINSGIDKKQLSPTDKVKLIAAKAMIDKKDGRTSDDINALAIIKGYADQTSKDNLASIKKGIDEFFNPPKKEPEFASPKPAAPAPKPPEPVASKPESNSADALSSSVEEAFKNLYAPKPKPAENSQPAESAAPVARFNENGEIVVSSIVDAIKSLNGEPVSKPKPAPITKQSAPSPAKESVPKPVVEKAAPEAAAEKPIPKPVIERTAPEAVVEKPVSESVIERVAPEPVVEKPVPEPVIERTAPEAVVEKPVSEPVIERAAPEPVVEKPVPEPVIEIAASEPVAAKPVSEPVIERTAPEPVAEKPVQEPVIEKAAPEPVPEAVHTEPAPADKPAKPKNSYMELFAKRRRTAAAEAASSVHETAPAPVPQPSPAEKTEPEIVPEPAAAAPKPEISKAEHVADEFNFADFILEEKPKEYIPAPAASTSYDDDFGGYDFITDDKSKVSKRALNAVQDLAKAKEAAEIEAAKKAAAKNADTLAQEPDSHAAKNDILEKMRHDIEALAEESEHTQYFEVDDSEPEVEIEPESAYEPAEEISDGLEAFAFTDSADYDIESEFTEPPKLEDMDTPHSESKTDFDIRKLQDEIEASIETNRAAKERMMARYGRKQKEEVHNPFALQFDEDEDSKKSKKSRKQQSAAEPKRLADPIDPDIFFNRTTAKNQDFNTGSMPEIKFKNQR